MLDLDATLEEEIIAGAYTIEGTPATVFTDEDLLPFLQLRWARDEDRMGFPALARQDAE